MNLTNRIPNEMIAIIVHWLLFIIVIAGVAGVMGVLIVIVEKKVTKAYRENCWDVISVGVAVISLAVAVYFGDWIKFFVKLLLMLRCEKYRRKVDKSYGKIGKSYCREWNYLCVGRG